MRFRSLSAALAVTIGLTALPAAAATGADTATPGPVLLAPAPTDPTHRDDGGFGTADLTRAEHAHLDHTQDVLAQAQPHERVSIVEPAPADALDRVDTASLYEAAGLPAPRTANAAPAPVTAAYTGAGGTIVPGLSGHVAQSCTGTGTDGNRVQMMYVREADQASRYTDIVPIIRAEARHVDDIFAVSAKQTGGGKRVRWVHNNCTPTVLNVTVPDGALSSFSATTQALRSLGYNQANRKYLAYTDTTQGLGYACGQAEFYPDTNPTGNWNDGKAAQIIRINSNCWVRSQQNTTAHELVHSLGAVLDAAPNGSAAGHCDDASDVMCYDDGTTGPMRQVCPADQINLLDCGKNDYFNTSPAAGSYLASNWNIANSTFLDTVAALPDAPTVTVTADRSSAESGDTITFQADSSKPATVTWQATHQECVQGSTTGATFTLRCPWTISSQATVRATATADTGNGVTGTGSKAVTVTRADAPAFTITGPTSAKPGEVITYTAKTTAGKAPFTYKWDVLTSGCSFSGGRTTSSPKVTCTDAAVGQYAEVRLTLTSADEQDAVDTAYTSITKGGTVSPPPPDGGDPDPTGPTFTMRLDPSGLSGVATRARVDTGGATVAAWEWSASKNCLVGNRSRSTVNVQCPLHVTGPVTITAVGTTNDGNRGTAAATITLTKPAATVQVTTKRVTRGTVVTGRVIEDATGMPVRALMKIQTSTDGGRSWGNATRAQVRTNGEVAKTFAARGAAQYRIWVAGAKASTPVRVGTVSKASTRLSLGARGKRPAVFRGVLANDSTGARLGGKPVVLQVRWAGSARWQNVGRAATNGRGVVRHTYRVTRRTGAGKFRLRFPGDAAHRPVRSVARLVRP